MIDQRREKIDLFQVGVRKFISIIQNQVVMGCNLFREMLEMHPSSPLCLPLFLKNNFYIINGG